MTTRKIVVSALISALAGGTQLAQATDVFRLEGYGAISRSMGGTAVAHDVGPAGMMTNPATLSLMTDGDQALIGLDLVTTDIKVKNTRTGESVSSDTHANNRGPYVAPEAAFTKRIGAWSFGVGAFAQGGLGVEYGNGSFLSRDAADQPTGLANSSRLLVLNIPFAASFQATEKLTIAGSLDAMWQGLNLDLLLTTNQVGTLAANGRVNGGLFTGVLVPNLAHITGAHFSLTKDQFLGSGVDAWGFGGKLGMLYKVSPDTTLGASYSFKSQMDDMSGRATLTAVFDSAANSPNGATNFPLGGKIQIKDFQMPAHLDVGIGQRLSSQWLVTADVSRVFWKDVMKDIKVTFVADGGLGDINILLPQDYKDQTVFSIGTAYDLNDSLTLRGGFRFATQALRSSTLFAVIPATPTKHLSAGFTYAFTKQSKLDFAYSHAFKETMDNPGVAGGSSNAGDPIQVTHSQNNATLNYRYSF
jgi:long-chain fatty acid transport protein